MSSECVYAKTAGYAYVGEVIATGKRFEDGRFYVIISPTWFRSSGSQWEKYCGSNRVFLKGETKPVVAPTDPAAQILPPGYSFK